jgi:hypothetical protein
MLRLAAEPKRWMSVTAPGVGCARFQSRWLDQKARDDPVDDLQHRRE